jgi:hypothetical protein
MSKRPTNPGGQTPRPADDEVIRLSGDEPVAAAGANTGSTPSTENAEIEALLGRLPLATPGSRLDLRVHAVLNDASISRSATETQTAADVETNEPLLRPSALAVWLRRARPIALASAAVLALAFGVGPLLRPHKPVVGGLPGSFQQVVHTTEPQPIPRELLDDSELTARLLLQAEANQSDPSAAAAPVAPVGLQQTFERVQDDGVVMVDGKAAYQRLRRQAIRQIVVVDPQTGEHATVSIPVQELLVRKLEPF